MSKLLIVLAVVCFAAIAQSHHCENHWSNSWSNGFQHMIRNFVGDNIQGGWKVEVTFNQTIDSLTVHNSRLGNPPSSNGGRTWHIVNESYNDKLWAGQQMNVDMTGTFSSTWAPRVESSSFQGVNCS